MAGRKCYPFKVVSADNLTALLYQELPFPWPFHSRFLFIVQDYCRLKEGGFVCYNTDVEHPYFSQRESFGFERGKMRFQGMVGVSTQAGELGTSRLTWLVNVDFGGLVPASAVRSGLITGMYYPKQVGKDLRANAGPQPDAALKVTVLGLRAELRAKDEALKEKDDEIKRLRAELGKGKADE